jgi:hypothetical protein
MTVGIVFRALPPADPARIPSVPVDGKVINGRRWYES